MLIVKQVNGWKIEQAVHKSSNFQTSYFPTSNFPTSHFQTYLFTPNRIGFKTQGSQILFIVDISAIEHHLVFK